MEKVTKSTDLPCASKNDMETLLVLKVLPRSLMLVLNASGLSPRSYPLLRFGWPRSGIRKGQTEDAKPSWPLESVRTLSPHAYFEKHGEGFKSVASFWTKTSPLDPEKKMPVKYLGFSLCVICYPTYKILYFEVENHFQIKVWNILITSKSPTIQLLQSPIPYWSKAKL